MDDDLTTASTQRILAVCRAMVACTGCVLHGSPVMPALSSLAPRRANDADKPSGNQSAVYAGQNVEAVLMHAVINRTYLSTRFTSYRLGYRFEAGHFVPRVTANVYTLVKQSDPRVYTDGFVYVFDRTYFHQSPECAVEFFALTAVIPSRRLKVPASVGQHLLGEYAIEILPHCESAEP